MTPRVSYCIFNLVCNCYLLLFTSNISAWIVFVLWAKCLLEARAHLDSCEALLFVLNLSNCPLKRIEIIQSSNLSHLPIMSERMIPVAGEQKKRVVGPAHFMSCSVKLVDPLTPILVLFFRL